ncbi:MAG TPA: hypothetical protein PLE19_05330 [Planctomycetota bacterium]|nr:hypothetical protein [Planctomycetota bacterium]HRR80888.1 hypothetical protein [Planctomycetota bacterium]HRT95831.1 hypothetical protein [Planctomycetota bacterium]
MTANTLLAVLMAFSFVSAGEEGPPVAVRLFDTGAASAAPLAPEALGKRDGWTQVAEGKTDHAFKGDAAAMNNCVAIVVRKGAAVIDLYSLAADGARLLATLQPIGAAKATPAPHVRAIKNAQGVVAVELFGLQVELGTGRPFVKTTATAGTTELRIEASCRFAVMPDFFADDIVVDASAIPAGRADLPFENFLLHFVGDGEAILAAISPDQGEDSFITMSGQGEQRRITASTIPYGKSKTLWLAALADKGVWHVRDVAKEDADRVLKLDWKAPFQAQWRVDWRLDDGLNDSWEMLIQLPDGKFDKPDWFGQSDRVGTPDWMKANRQRWTTVLGTFQYPCWLDREGQGFLQPLKKGLRFQGPALLYPLHRVQATPLDRFTLVDAVRECLGVGPCEYVLDVEGQRKVARGAATCATRTRLDGIYAAKQQGERRAEVEKALDDVLAFVQLVRGRIEAYAQFGREQFAWLEDQRKAKPELAEALTQMQGVLKRIESAYANRQGAIRPAGDAVALVDDFRRNLVGYEGADALDRCKQITKALVGIGGAQDELVGECRMAVKVLRQRAGLAMASDPRMGDIARELRRRTQAILRAPAGYEAPRH